MKFRTKLGNVGGLVVSHALESKGDRHPFLDCGLDGLIIVNQVGYTPLSVLLRGRNDFAEKFGDETIFRILYIAEQLYQCNIPRIARAEITGKNKLKSICLTPTTETDFYVKNFSKVIWSDRRSEYFKWRNEGVWRDYIYAMTFYSLLLISKNHRIGKCGISHLTNTGFGGAEHMADAIVNFAKLHGHKSPIPEIVYCGCCIHPSSIIVIPYDTPEHRDCYHAFGYNAEFDYEYVEVQLSSPFKWLRVS